MKNQDLERIARARIARARKSIDRSLQCIDQGNPLAAEVDPERLRKRLQTKAALSREEAEGIALGIRAFARASATDRPKLTGQKGPEAIWGRTIDFVGIAFLERGAAAARSVARVAFLDGRAQGSGVMVSDRLFLTNHHVIESAAAAGQFCVEFDYELDPTDRPRGATRFALDPQTFFLSDPVSGLDYTLIALGKKIAGPRRLEDFGWCALSGAQDKHALGEVANVVQHPDGRYKEVVLRENQLVARLDYVLHYTADTEPGSSGSPVFNNEWQMIALHHWGGPWRQKVGANGRPLNQDINEGIRASAIVTDLVSKSSRLGDNQRPFLDRVVRLGEAGQPQRPQDGPASDTDGTTRVDSDGRVSWRIPIELSVRLPALSDSRPSAGASVPSVSLQGRGGEARLRPTTEYADRSGYKPRFIEGFRIEMPRLSQAQKADAARNLQADAGDDPFELKYHHFSIVMNERRRLAFFTACNIDGSKAKHVDRDSGDVSALEPDDPRLESLDAAGAEASDRWYDDERLAESDYAGADVYEKQVVAGFPNTRSMARTLRMFQRGHLVRRMDPAWGTNKQALLADADTFHWTNCSPQVGFFNMGRAPANTPNSGGGLLWRALENYVLRNAVAENARVSCFTGPVFTNQDREFRGIRVPGRFWKVVVWAENGELRSLAMIADQRPVIRVWPEALEEAGSEAYGDPNELALVEDFLTTVDEIERLTRLDFGKDVRAADINVSGERIKVKAFDEIPLGRSRARRSANGRAAAGGKTNGKTNGKATRRKGTPAVRNGRNDKRSYVSA